MWLLCNCSLCYVKLWVWYILFTYLCIFLLLFIVFGILHKKKFLPISVSWIAFLMFSPSSLIVSLILLDDLYNWWFAFCFWRLSFPAWFLCLFLIQGFIWSAQLHFLDSLRNFLCTGCVFYAFPFRHKICFFSQF